LIYSQSTVYAVEALGYMTSLPAGKAVKAKDIAARLNIPEHFLGKVLSQLVKKKFISSTKGPTGGFSLLVNPSSITLYRILASLDALANLEDECVMGLKECSNEHPCAFHDRWTVFREEAIARAQRLTLTELSEIVMAKL
jgi:Rrf2 family protein